MVHNRNTTPPQPGHTGFEPGFCSQIEVRGTEVIKVTNTVYDSFGEAEKAAYDLSVYGEEIGKQPLSVVPLREVGVVEDPTGYRLRHVYDLVDGPSMVSASNDNRYKAVSSVLAQVAAMDTLRGSNDKLAVPFDAKSENFHIDPQEGPVLIDIFPALSRLPDGSFPLSALVDGVQRGRRGLWPWVAGTKSGAMTKILSTAIDRGGSKAEKLKHIALEVDDWCYDALPSNMDGRVRSSVRRQIGTHFLPYMLRVAHDRVWQKING